MHFPISLILFGLAGVVLLLQAIPVTGLLLALLRSALWPMYLINAGLLAVVLDVYLGRVGRFWLAVPFLWFGAWLIAAWVSHVEVVRLEGRVAAMNMGKAVPFSPAQQSLVVEAHGYSRGGIVQDLIGSYALPVVFEKEQEADETVYRSHRIGRSEMCVRLRANNALREKPDRFVRDTCVYSSVEAPTVPAVTVILDEIEKAHSFSGRRLRHLAIQPPDSKPVELLAAYAAPLRWFPAFLIGCGANVMTASWDCTAKFLRQPLRALGPHGSLGAVPVIAAALGLRSNPVSIRRSEIGARGHFSTP